MGVSNGEGRRVLKIREPSTHFTTHNSSDDKYTSKPNFKFLRAILVPVVIAMTHKDRSPIQ
jgi:hypothetical protein